MVASVFLVVYFCVAVGAKEQALIQLLLHSSPIPGKALAYFKRFLGGVFVVKGKGTQALVIAAHHTLAAKVFYGTYLSSPP